ncbi:hypothetical protein WA158_007944 [Blastocystis sp. Blastoise]
MSVKNTKHNSSEYIESFRQYSNDDFHFQEFKNYYEWDYDVMQYYIDPNNTSFESFFEYYKTVQTRCENKTLSRNIIVFEPTTSGMGNKLLGLSLAMYFAMMTNSHFMICNWPSFPFYFNLSFPITVTGCKKLNISKTIYYTSPCINHGNAIFPPLSTLFNTSLTRITINCGVIDRIQLSNHMKMFLNLYNINSKENNRVFIRSRVLHNFLNYMIYPSKYVEDSINEKYKSFSSYDTIGIHLRFGKYSDFNKTKDKNDVFLIPSDIDYFISVAKIISKRIKSNKIKWYISSDSTFYKNQLQQQYPNQVITLNTTVIHSGLSSITGYSNGVVDSISEMYLLSKCKYIIRYSESSFSSISCSLKDDENCVIVYKNKKTNKLTFK